VVVLRQMSLIAAVVGTSVTVTATEHVDVWLVLGAVAGWSFVPVLQLATGALLTRGSRVPVGTALGHYFATHWPWSMTILTVHAALLVVPWFRANSLWLLCLGIVPVVWTIRLLLAVCEGPLGMERRKARRRVLEHQLLTFFLIVLYVQFAIALWPRVLGVLS
jgi:hypothetical protein